MQVKLSQGQLPIDGIAHRLREDLIVEKGSYIVLSKDGETLIQLSKEEFQRFYGPDASVINKRKRIHRHWIDVDTVIVRFLMEQEEWLSQGPINKAVGLSPGTINSRLQFLTRHGYINVRRQHGQRQWKVTQKGREHPKEVNNGTPGRLS